REPRVPGQERAVQVRPVDAAGAAALVAGLAVVPEAGEHAPERLCALVEVRPAGVVLEAGDRPARPSALEEDVADHAPLAADPRERQEPNPGQLHAGAVAVEPAEELVAAAHGEDGGAARDRVPQRVGLAREVGRDERLLAVLAAAHVEEVDPAR